jgi:DNA-binding transcriptional LysR family regulator
MAEHMDRMAAMEAFVVVVDTGSFSAAARRLNVGQPAVSKTVAQLEERLGVKLLVRTTRGLTATEAGLNYYERARRSIEEADEAELAARGAGSSLRGKLRFCAAVTFARIHLMPHLPEFLAQHPELEIEAVLDDRNIDLVHERIDVALRMGRLADSMLRARRIASGPQVIVGTPTYFARAGEPAAPGDLSAHDAVIYDQGAGGEDWTLQRDNANIAVTLKGRLRVSAAEGVRAAVLANAVSQSLLNGCSRPKSKTARSRSCCEVGRCRRLISGRFSRPDEQPLKPASLPSSCKH